MLKRRKKAQKEEKKDDFDDEIEKRDMEIAEVFRQSRNRGGRPTKLNEILIRDMEILARIGLSDKAIAESVGIGPDTLIRWMKRNREFSNRLKRAKGEGKARLVNSIYGHGRKSWQAHAWLLERQYQDEFALTRKVEMSSAEKKPLRFQIIFDKTPLPPENGSSL
jgi:hypothetical protein